MEQAAKTANLPYAPKPRIHFKENYLVALLLWKFRLACPDFTVIITETDKQAFNESLKFQEQTPTIKVEEVRAGLRIRMEDEKTGNDITTTENNEQAYDAGQRAKRFITAVKSIPQALVEQQGQEKSGTFTSTDLQRLLQTIHETAPVL